MLISSLLIIMFGFIAMLGLINARYENSWIDKFNTGFVCLASIFLLLGWVYYCNLFGQTASVA